MPPPHHQPSPPLRPTNVPLSPLLTAEGSGQARLWPDPQPKLADYDLLLVSSSGGKDSSATLAVTVEQADRVGVRHRIVVAHADLGRVEWPGTVTVARSHARHYGLRFEVVRRTITDPTTGQQQPQDLLDHIAARRLFPDAKRRYCTSDHKRGPLLKLMTKLVSELREVGAPEPVRVLSIMGFRAEESPARAKRPTLRLDERASNGRRHVEVWLPIHGWLVNDVWSRIHREGLAIHPAYTEHGMPRLSCRFCVLASKSALLCSARANPDLANAYAAVERDTGHRFRADLSMAQIIAEARTNTPAVVESWAA
jgi:3'-phosphoadenosine 5'-phosphosulfate sulfotransferase (PAPS reductase)/FAD synthetase